jgi:hypothetical protein
MAHLYSEFDRPTIVPHPQQRAIERASRSSVFFTCPTVCQSVGLKVFQYAFYKPALFGFFRWMFFLQKLQHIYNILNNTYLRDRVTDSHNKKRFLFGTHYNHKVQTEELFPQ